MPRKNDAISKETADYIARRIQLKGLISGQELLQIAKKEGIGNGNAYIRLIVEGLEAKGWLIFQEDTPNHKCVYGVMDYNNGRSQCLVM